MEETILSLKNIYRILTQRDYPVYSQDVIREKDRRGLTILKFWEEILLPEWKSGKYGRLIWREEGKRSRFSSELFQRKDSFPYYASYIQEILSHLTPEKYLWQMQRFQHFLSEKHYQSSAFRIKALALIDACSRQDPCFSRSVASFFRAYRETEDIPGIFLDSWVLTAMFLHACAGMETRSSLLQELRMDEHYSPQSLARLHFMKGTPGGVRHIISPGSEISAEPVAPSRFFGRERELFDLIEYAHESSKVLVSGGGGIGKTELLRQLKKEVLSDGTFDAIAEIQYAGGLSKSLASTFQDYPGDSAEQKVREILYELRHTKEHWLLLIDNALLETEDLPLWAELAELPVGIIVTSRNHPLDGFVPYPLSPLPDRAAWLVFRSHFQKKMTQADDHLLIANLSEDSMRYPLVMSMLGRAARYNGWTVDEMVRRFQRGIGDIAWKEKGILWQINKVCGDLYQDSLLNGNEKAIIRLMSILPYQSYSVSILSELCGLNLSSADLKILLDQLYHKGWLECSASAYSLHPLLAEEFVGSSFTEHDFPGLWENTRKIIPHVVLSAVHQVQPTQAELSTLVLHAANTIKGSVSSELMDLCLDAAWQITASGDGGRNVSLVMHQLMDRMEKCTWQQQAMLQVMECISENYDVTALQSCIDRGFEENIPAEDLTLLFLWAIPRMAEEDAFQSMAQDDVDRLKACSDSDALHLLSSFIAFSRALNLGEATKTLSCFLEMKAVYEQAENDLYSSLLSQAWANTVFLLFAQEEETDSASALYQEYQTMPFRNRTVNQQILRLRMDCAYEHFTGHSEKAVECMRQLMTLVERRSGKHNRTYTIAQYDLAFYLKNSGKTDESAALFEDLISQGDQPMMNPDYFPMLLVTAGTVYLQTGNLDRAEELLQKAESISVERSSPFAKAYADYWLSVLWKNRHNEAQEIACLLSARDYYVSTYGMENERSRQICERLEELQGAENQT